MASTLDPIEKTLADAYRKEIDQEENVWRSVAELAILTSIGFTVFLIVRLLLYYMPR